MRVLITFFAGLFGLAFGSFLNVCLSRWPDGESIVSPSSHCRICGRELRWWENIPLLSWLALRGRCRTCKSWIGLRYPLVEAAVGVLWAAEMWNAAPVLLSHIFLGSIWGYAFVQLSQMFFLWLLVALAVLDYENLWLPDALTIPGATLGFLSVLYSFWLSGRNVLAYYGASGLMRPMLWRVAWHRLLAIFAAALLILAIRWLYQLIRHREGLGLGDAKLMALLAAWLGLAGALVAFFFGVVLAALAALLLLAAPRLRHEGPWAEQKLPLGTFLSIGGIVSALWGQLLLALYFRWAGL
jgi:leader peptidase (prepilin peptidase)/N-methyltransferase